MAGIRGKNTKPELLVRKGLFARGFRYRINSSSLPGKPDIKLTKYRAVILVHGCFWHGHSCRLFRLPSSNVAFWTAKIAANRERDARDVAALRAAGWRVCIIWECLVKSAPFRKDPSKIINTIGEWIEGQTPFLELFDAKAVPAPDIGSTGDAYSEIGINSDPGCFAAERSVRYGPEA